MKASSLLYTIILTFLPVIGLSQSANLLKNGSLEDSRSKQGEWIFPKIKNNHPDAFYAFAEKLWNVDKQPYDGSWYTGLVVRDDGSFEVLGQKLKNRLVANKKYLVSLYLCTSTKMTSFSPLSNGQEVSFGKALNVRISIGNSYKMSRIILETGAVTNEEWMEYTFEIQPDVDVKCFWIESAHLTGYEGAYNGNVFVDMVSLRELE